MEIKKANGVQKSKLYTLLVGIFAFSVMTLTACASDTKQIMKEQDSIPPYSEEYIEAQQEGLPSIQFSMPAYEFTYSGELADLIVVEAIDGTNDLRVRVKEIKGEVSAFILHFNSTESEFVQFFSDAKGNRIPVAFEMLSIPEGLSEEEIVLFYTAQDSVNEIVETLELK